MRDIKFRGKIALTDHPREGEWVIAPDHVDLSDFWKMVEHLQFIDPSTVAQCQGQKDKFNNTFYEHDIVLGGCADNCIVVVVWDDTNSQWAIGDEDHLAPYGDFGLWLKDHPECEILGTIHDKGKDDKPTT